MKMNLKKIKKLDLNIINKKNYFIFLISFFIVSLIIGIIFFNYLNNNDKEILSSNINSYFTINDSYNYLKVLLESIKNNFLGIVLIILLGISIIGIFLILFLYFAEGFTLGFTISSIIYTYKLKGIIGIISYLIPSKIIYLIMLFILTYFAIRFSYKLFCYFILKKDIDLHEEMHKYLKKGLICLLIGLVCSLLEVFVSPLMIKLFTLFTK